MLYLQGLEADGRPAGNLHFKNVTVKGDRDRPILEIRDRKGHGLQAITGEIILERQGRRETIAFDDAWLERMREWASAFTPDDLRPPVRQNSLLPELRKNGHCQRIDGLQIEE